MIKSILFSFFAGAIAIHTIAQAGLPDPNFDANGVVLPAINDTTSRAYAIAVQPDQKILAAGSVLNGTDYDFVLVRVHPDGSPDTDFGNEGIVITDFMNNDEAQSMALQPDGKIIVAGVADGGDRFAIARYLPDGSPDNTFSSDGKNMPGLGCEQDYDVEVLLQDDGKIVLAGSNTEDEDHYFALFRYNADGTPDASFNPDNAVTGLSFAAAIQEDGKILMGGRTLYDGNFNSDFLLARFNPDGSLDNTFSFDGKTETDINGDVDIIFAMELQNDGKIVAGGYGREGILMAVLARYETDGILDDSFGSLGIYHGGISEEFTNMCLSLFVQPDNKILASGYYFDSQYYEYLARFNSDGTFDSTFATDGKYFTQDIGRINAVAMQNDGKILTAGHIGNSGKDMLAIRRFTNDITLVDIPDKPSVQPYPKIAPNPFYDHVSISINRQGPHTFRIYSSLGKEVYAGILNDPETTIGLGFLEPGIYVLSIVHAEYNWTGRVMKY